MENMKYFEETKQILDKSRFFFIVATNMDGKYTYINSHYAKEFYSINNSFVGKPYQISMHPDDIKTCEEVSAKCFGAPDELFPATIRKHDGNGGYIITQWEYKAIFDEENKPAGIFCLGYNITKYEEEKKQLNYAEAEILKKSAILKNIAFQQSHLIRAPLTNIMGLVDILDKMEVDNNINNICKMILESSNKLDKVIRDIVDLTYK